MKHNTEYENNLPVEVEIKEITREITDYMVVKVEYILQSITGNVLPEYNIQLAPIQYITDIEKYEQIEKELNNSIQKLVKTFVNDLIKEKIITEKDKKK